MKINTNEWNAYINSVKAEVSKLEGNPDQKYWKDEASYLQKITEEAEKEAAEYSASKADGSANKPAEKNTFSALLLLATVKAELGIDFEESLSFLEERAAENDVDALKNLGFLYCTGVYNYFDESKTDLMDINAKENEEKSTFYFEKAASLGSAHALDTLFNHLWIFITRTPEEAKVQPTDQDYLKAEEMGLKVIDIFENHRESCDLSGSAISFTMKWLSDLYAYENPASPIYSPKKADYWEKRSQQDYED